jgi:putative transposase
MMLETSTPVASRDVPQFLVERRELRPLHRLVGQPSGTTPVHCLRLSGHIVYTPRMPWTDTTSVMERRRFIADLETGRWSMTELSARYAVSRPTGHKWWNRYRSEGATGLEDRSRAPHSCAHRTPARTEELVLRLKAKYGWGARKLQRLLKGQMPETEVPHRSTVFDILKRHGLVRKKRRRTKWRHPGAARLRTAEPNEVWTVDFKGQFRTRDGVYCYPLTVLDNFSRFLLCCKALPNVRTAGTKAAFERLFRHSGLPDAIRSDNGVPFASTGIHGLCELNV